MSNGNECVDCQRDTSFGSGLYVNRIPADDGYLCPECQEIECEACGDYTFEYCYSEELGFVCDGCAGDNEED